MSLALTAILVVASIFSILFVLRRYRTATPAQQRQILIGGIGAAVLALAIGSLNLFR